MVEAVTDNALVVAPPVRERLRAFMSPVFDIEKSVVVAVGVEEAIRKRLRFEPLAPFGVATVNCAKGEEVPIPILPTLSITKRLAMPLVRKERELLLCA